MAKETADQESTRHKKYYDQNFKCMQIVPGDLVLVWVKAFGPNHKIADHWEQVSYKVFSQHHNSPVYRVQPFNDSSDESIHTLHRNMLFPFQSLREDETQQQNVALVNADLAMMVYFSKVWLKLLFRDKQCFCWGEDEVRIIVSVLLLSR